MNSLYAKTKKFGLQLLPKPKWLWYGLHDGYTESKILLRRGYNVEYWRITEVAQVESTSTSNLKVVVSSHKGSKLQYQ